MSCRRVIWLSDQDASKGYFVDFTAISMHAVMSDPESVEKPCLYIQLDVGDDEEEFYGAAVGDGTANGEGEAGSEDDDLPVPELRLIPADPATCE